MLSNNKRAALILLGLVIGAVLILEAGIANIPVRQAEPFSWQNPSVQMQPGKEMPVLGPNNLLLILFVIAIFSIFLSHEGRKRLLISILVLAILSLLLYMTDARPRPPDYQPADQETQLFFTAVPQEEEPDLYPAPPAEAFEPHTPGWLITLIGVFLALVLASIIAVVVGIVLQFRSGSGYSFSRAMSEQAQAAIDALEAAMDFKDAITRCYAQMSQVLQEERGLVRNDDMTPREFAQLLTQKDFPAEAVQALTRLFEQVRYGHLPPENNGVRTAIASLNAIRDHCLALKAAEKRAEALS